MPRREDHDDVLHGGDVRLEHIAPPFERLGDIRMLIVGEQIKPHHDVWCIFEMICESFDDVEELKRPRVGDEDLCRRDSRVILAMQPRAKR